MKYWINSVMYPLPSMVRMTKGHIYKGSPLYSTWYGRYCEKSGLVKQVKMLLQNGN